MLASFLTKLEAKQAVQAKAIPMLENTLLVPTLTQSVISIPQLFKSEIVITQTADKGASILIDKKFKLLGSLKNNLLEFHSSQSEAINSSSTCYQSSPVNPNWHAGLGHPNHQYQALMVPKSQWPPECSICKECKLKTLPFSSKFKTSSKDSNYTQRCGAYIGEGVAAGLSSCCR
ncbi:hypothetical protein VP01_4790g1 [Puccinia sorghi]|uniref:GAG-pre-integrase domain-containing protein n=1 Tax=Puccinia sorghi TaxID=27349 RepID=A0A0L6UMP1_9BASI|nr:hypothetical protein VP01_4790g1 [Puccinia sorghi]